MLQAAVDAEQGDGASILKPVERQLRLEPDAFTFLASLGTLFIYTPSRLTVVCAAEPGSGRPTLREYPAPGTRR